MDLTDVLGSHLQHANFGEPEFEEFVGILLREEVALRHDDARVQGPHKNKRADGGIDLRVVVNSQPSKTRRGFRAALTWDAIGTTVYSCKCSGRDGGWRPLVERDARLSSFRAAMKGKPPGLKAKEPPKKLLDHLAAGGRYVLVIHEPSGGEEDFFDELARGFAWWLERTSRSVPEGFAEQFELIEGNQLAEFIRTHRLDIPASLAHKLGVSDPRHLCAWEDWTQKLFGRDRPVFEPDSKRSELFGALDLADPGGPRVVWVTGPPGAGKTRSVYEALAARPDLAQVRVRYCDDVEHGLDAIKSKWFETVGSACLVLDEVRSMDADDLVIEFLAQASERSRLVLVGTSDGTKAWRSDRYIHHYELGRLDDEATRRIVARELEPSDSPDAEYRIDSVVHLSHGFPLFAVLLARALAVDEDTIEVPSDRKGEWHAAMRVLAGPRRHYADASTWTREAEVRAKCLLVVLLTHGLGETWDEIWDIRHEQLALAIDEPREWDLVKRAEAACVDREILRYTGSKRRRYVSPRNLGRIILNRYLGGPQPGGAERIQTAVPDLFSGLHELAEQLHASQDVRERLARAEWSGLVDAVRAGTRDGWLYSVSHEDGLYRAARVVPVFTVRSMADALRALDDRTLEGANSFRRALRGPLAHALHRKLGSEAFRELETVLFRLARFERDKTFVGNYTELWQHLFLVGVDDTHEPWSSRRQLLAQRLESADLDQRLAAMAALSLVLDRSESSFATSEYDAVDGPWPGLSLTGAEVFEAKRELWGLLLRLCNDEGDELADAARRVVAERLRDAIGRFAFAGELYALARSTVGWTAAQRQRLSQAVEQALRHELDEQEVDARGLLAPLRQLRDAVSPSSYHERLIQHVGSYRPGPWELTDNERPEYEQRIDDELVLEAVGRPGLLTADMGWLTSASATRAQPFANRLGIHDRDRRFLEPLLQAAREGRAFLPLEGYLLGWSTQDPATVERWLEDHMREPALANVVTLVLTRMEPSPDRLELLLDIITSYDVNEQLPLVLRRDRWLDAIPGETMVSFLHAISTRPAMAGTVVMVGARLLGRELPEAQRERLGEALAQGVRHWTSGRITMIGHRPWADAIISLIESGRIDDVIEAITAVLSADRGGPNILTGQRVLERIVARYGPDTLWDRFARLLLERTHDRYVAYHLARAGLREKVSTEALVAWVGDDRQRARVIAPMARLSSAEVDPLVVVLLERFGADNVVSAELRTGLRSRVRRGALVDEYRARLAVVEPYEQHASAPVRAWAAAVADDLRGSIRTREAAEEYRKHYA